MTIEEIESIDFLDHQDLMQTLDAEQARKNALGQSACNCVVDLIEVDPGDNEQPKISTSAFVQETFGLGTVDFKATGKSLILEPGKFIERVESVQNLPYMDFEKTSIEIIATKIKQFIDLTDEIDMLFRQKTSSLRGSRLKDPNKFRDYKKFQIELLEKNRRQIYRDSFGYSRMIHHGDMESSDFDTIYDADIVNIWSALSYTDESKQRKLNPKKVERYKSEIDQYVIGRESTR
jgi:hypothetical protein